LAAGQSGEIEVRASNTLELINGSRITVETAQANADDINLNVGHMVHLRDGSKITTSVAEGKGDGGNITVDPMFVVLDGASEIVAKAREGSGGNIHITITGNGAFFKSPDSVVDASSDFGIDGTVEIISPNTDLNRNLVALPTAFLDATKIFTKPCAQRSRAEFLRFVVRKYEVLPDSPYALRVYSPMHLK
jgi:hypothetical protein